jgi:hypothetical protein
LRARGILNRLKSSGEWQNPVDAFGINQLGGARGPAAPRIPANQHDGMGDTISDRLGAGLTFRGKLTEPTASPLVADRVSETEVGRAVILTQLERILANPLFKNSKRYPTLLRYVVERTLDGHPGELKERTLGIEVFGRDPDYDTNLDPVVRTTAAEIRKRLAQYYQEPNHESEPRIDLPLGSYAARFQAPAGKPAPVTSAERLIESVPVPLISPIPFTRRRAYRSLRLAALSGIPVFIVLGVWLKPWMPHSALDKLWSQILDSSSPVLLCVGQRPFAASSATEPQSSSMPLQNAPSPQTTLYQLYYLGSQNVALPDVMTLGRLTGFLQARGKAYHIRGESATTFEDLRDGPVVLIGAFNNDWSMRLMGPRRFSFERDGDIFWIKDVQNPSDRSHAVNYAMPYLNLTEDFALVSRVLDPVTERMVVLAGGLTGYGTVAAGEFLSNPAYMETITASAPGNWPSKNVEVLISTKVINGKSGPPKAAIAHFW